MQHKIEKVCVDMVKLAAPYLENPKKFYEEAYNRGVRTAYCRGGADIHRGYFCPSPIEDIIIGNVRRGKLLNQLPSKYTPDYEYRLDSEGKLCTVYQYGCRKEYILRSDDYEIGLQYYVDERIVEPVDRITLCTYQDDRIKMFATGWYSQRSSIIYNCTLEEFGYDDGQLTTVDHAQLFNGLFQYHRYVFQHDTNGYLSTYTSVALSGDGERLSEEVQYTAHKKRRV